MASAWNEEDKAAGRQSYFPPDETVQRNVHHNAQVIVRPPKRRG